MVNKPPMSKCRKIIFFQLYLKYIDIKPAAVLVFKHKDVILNVPDVFLMCLIFLMSSLNHPPTDSYTAWTRSRSSEFLLSFAITLLCYFFFLITHMRCFADPHRGPPDLCVCSISLFALRWKRSCPAGIHLATWQTVHINCSEKNFVFALLLFFYFATPLLHHHLLVFFSSSHPRFAARCHGNSFGGDTETDKGIPELKFSAAACLTEQK